MFTASFCILFLLKSIVGLPLPNNVPLFECGRVANVEQLRIIGGEEVRVKSWPWMSKECCKYSTNISKGKICRQVFINGSEKCDCIRIQITQPSISISTTVVNNERRFTGNTSNPTIGNGTSTETGRRPHDCGGVLINREWVLTAAHCLDNPTQPNVFPSQPPSHWRVTAGMHSRELNSTERSRWQVRSVRAFHYHPGYLDFTYTAFNDIALIRLSSPVKFNAFVRPICLPRRRVTNPGWNRCYAAGWGTTAEVAEQFSLKLREVGIPVVNHLGCKSRFGMSYDAKQHLCGGDWFNGNKDSCQGDSGGPLACQLDNGSWYVAGIISWGMGCGRKRTPGIYTNVRSYENWILSILISSSSADLRLIQSGYVRA